jgi:sorbose reductase
MEPIDLSALSGVRARFDLTDRVAVVTGAAGGIGRSTAAALADLGATVAVADIPARLEQSRAVADAIASRYGSEAMGVGADVTDERDVDRLFEAVLARFGRLDVVHSNAGMLPPEDHFDMPLSDWNRTLDVNLTGMFLVDRRAAQILREQGRGGSIINTASISGSIINQAPEGGRHAVAYTAAKAGVRHLTKAMAVDLADVGIRVNSVSPGLIVSGMHTSMLAEQGLNYGDIDSRARSAPASIPMGRFGTLDELGGIVAFLATDLASFITGADILVDGGATAW